MTKAERMVIYNKYNGHCAYCGCKLEYKDMQVDHIEARYNAEYKGQEVDNSIDNLNPSCRQCNFYKGTWSLDTLRKNVEETLLNNLEKNFNYRLAVKYGFISEIKRHPVKFYFETFEDNVDKEQERLYNVSVSDDNEYTMEEISDKTEKGCVGCPYAGRLEYKECPNAYTDVSEKCNLYSHELVTTRGGNNG